MNEGLVEMWTNVIGDTIVSGAVLTAYAKVQYFFTIVVWGIVININKEFYWFILKIFVSNKYV